MTEDRCRSLVADRVAIRNARERQRVHNLKQQYDTLEAILHQAGIACGSSNYAVLMCAHAYILHLQELVGVHPRADARAAARAARAETPGDADAAGERGGAAVAVRSSRKRAAPAGSTQQFA